ncbi:Mitochondrial ribosomal protein L15 precursor [Klebsormidium nitens]|uniref:Mitochondrial ribosomal protein L15 n=1 Tax=Klebsormidium nitens TaxID=105231 RepID=A0A1Y1HVX2_KLENI|nr:Mitochondrial ribosomal protein L15 precursor [Klebsormidium nitens]|eukprot:GAQ82313.1 Mitochondrial ribosomal protein L15 precursor [Klebsormidium nitens]
MRHLEKLGRLALRHAPRDGVHGPQACATLRVESWDQATEISAEELTSNQFGLHDCPDECGNAGYPAGTLHDECSTSSRCQGAVQATRRDGATNHHHSSPSVNSCLVGSLHLRRPLRSPSIPDGHLWQQTPARGFAASALPTETMETVFRERYVPPGGFLALNNLRDNPGAKKEKKRLGRGTGSGLGKTSGRGHKGQKARAGRKPRAGFEGGQTPLRLSIPKRGFHNPFSLDFQVLNLNRLTDYIEKGKIDPNNLITMKTLKDAGAIGKAMRDGVKLLGRGSDEFKHPIKIEVTRVSEQARKTIEAAGGTVTTVYYNKLGLRALYKPEWFIKKGRMIPRPARPPPKMRGKTDTIGRLPAPTTPLELEGEGSVP